MALKPQVPQPVVTRKPSTPVTPMIGLKSAEMSQIPAHVAQDPQVAQERQQPRDLVARTPRSAANDDWREYDGCESNSAPMSIWPRSVCET